MPPFEVHTEEDLNSKDAPPPAEPEIIEQDIPDFPEMAWRGAFGEYREAVKNTTEASDVFHFAAFWAACAVSLGRRVYTYSGDIIYPNFYGALFGPSGDKKTTAQRRIINTKILPSSVQVIPNLGSTEGLAATMTRPDGSDAIALMFWEEFTSLFSRGRWDSAILEFITEAFDCPSDWKRDYVKNPIHIVNPTPTIIAGTTPEWFWKNARAEDFHGGVGNRFLYFAGTKKTGLPNPKEPGAQLQQVREALARLSMLPETKVGFSFDARELWEKFYMKWEAKDRPGLHGAATKRIHVYVRKLAMVYAALEGTLPEITKDQLAAAIAVGVYCSECARVLVDAQNAAIRPEGQIEQRFIEWVKRHPGAKKRYMQQTLTKVAGSCEVFNRIIISLCKAEEIEIKENRVYPWVTR